MLHKKTVRLWAALLIVVFIFSVFTETSFATGEEAKEEFTYSKTKSTVYTPEKLEAVRKNMEKYSWASSIKYAVLDTANYYIVYGNDFLWNLVTDQNLPRSYAVNQPLGCLNCGKAIDKFGNYPYNANHFNAPWKLECPNCHLKFPTNDFNAYYKSGLDENHRFNPELADKSLLVNTLYPEKGEKWGVDDGYGYTDEDGNRYTFIAYYNHWHLWYGGAIEKAITSLRDAYVYTGNMKYARAGSILLDRIADVYPEMDIDRYKKSDGFLNSDGGSGRGKVVGCIWETGLVENYLTAYDAFFPVMDDPEIVEFLSEKARQYHLGTKDGVGIRKNIEDNIVRQVYPAVVSAQIRGNNGMHQSTLATAAVVLDSMPETKEWLDFNFQSGAATGSGVSGGNILATFVNDVDRDGHGNESAPGYNRLWLSQYIDVANTLAGYELYPAADLYENPKFRKMFLSMIPLMLTDKYSAIIGDTAATGNPTIYVDLNQMILAYQHYKDPLLAQVIYFLNKNSTEGIHGDIYHEDPEQVGRDIQKTIDEYGPLVLKSDNLTGYGLSVLRDGYRITVDSGIHYILSDLPRTATADAEDIRSQRMILHAQGLGDSVRFTLNVQKSDVYAIELGCVKSGSSGIYDIFLDSEQIGTVDFAGGGFSYVPLREMVLDSGDHELEFICKGKSEKSTGYELTLSDMVLYDPKAQDMKDLADLGDTQKALWMYYGISNGHGHADTLNIGINAFGLDLAPELGYPEYADSTPHRMEWVNNTISHNTVVVDRSKQDLRNKVEVPLHFDESEYVRLTDVDAPSAYLSKDVDYRRSVAMIKVNDTDFYAVDFFRVQGGSEHLYSFHGAEGVVTVEGLDLISQTDSTGKMIGTYAGPDTEFGVRPSNDALNSGFHWLTNVRKDTDPKGAFSVDWNVKDTWNALGKGKSSPTDIHIRLTMLNETDEVAITTGTPPRNKSGNPKELEYLLASRYGNDLDSLFTSVIEPYKGERIIEEISNVSLTAEGKPYDGNDAVCIKVVFKDGRTDYIIYSVNDELDLAVEDKFTFKGFFGVYSERDGIPFYTYTNDGAFNQDQEITRYSGKVVDFTRELSMENRITVEFNQEPDLSDIIGRMIYIKNNGDKNAVYKILGAVKNGNKTVLDIGDVTTVKAWADNSDFSKGYLYFMAQGDEFVIPLGKESISSVALVDVSPNRLRLPVAGTAKLSFDIAYASGARFTETDGALETVNTKPWVALCQDGTVTALKKGETELYIKIRRGGESFRSEMIVLTVYIPKEQGKKTRYIQDPVEMAM